MNWPCHLFCYELPALPQLLAQLHARGDARLLVTRAGPGCCFVSNWPATPWNKREQLFISYLEACPQPAFDEMLWASDLNLVRGEDSLVRALWAGQPLVWQIYPQHDDAHTPSWRPFWTGCRRRFAAALACAVEWAGGRACCRRSIAPPWPNGEPACRRHARLLAQPIY